MAISAKLENDGGAYDVLNAKANAGLRRQNIAITSRRLAGLLGLPWAQEVLMPTPMNEPETFCSIRICWSCRPFWNVAPICDLPIGRWPLPPAKSTLRWLFLRLMASSILDRTMQRKGFQNRTGLRFDWPDFNRNEGG